MFNNYTEECSVNITRVGAITMSDNETVAFNFINGENIWGSGTHTHNQRIVSCYAYVHYTI